MKSKPVSQFKISSFINEETYGGVLLILATIIALVWANSSFYESYHHVWHEIKVGIAWGEIDLIASIHHWINDGLMAIFFFVIGLEIKREVMGGELSTLKKATLPIAAAVGGMILPAILYLVINIKSPEFDNGWGIPMATDIAFALGLMAMLGKRVPLNLKIFLTALAIADDLGAVMVIAIFYTETIDLNELMYAAFFLGILTIANYAGVRKTIFYTLVGFAGVWIAFVYSGVHATIAGVLIALTIPARAKIDENEYADRLTSLFDKYKKQDRDPNTSLLSKGQAHVLSEIAELNKMAHTPLQRIEHTLHPVSAYFILPIFALSNAGVHIDGKVIDMLLHPISIGIFLGLVLGKFIGITLLSQIVVRMRLTTLPEGVQWNHIYGASFLAGIGFTMSMFISDLAFEEEKYIQIAKVGIMAASFVSALLGMIWLVATTKKES